MYQCKLKGEKVGVVFGSFAPMHQGHLDVIMRAKKSNDGGCIVIVCGHDGDKGEPLLPHKKRYRYVRELFADDDLVSVWEINDTKIGAAAYPNGWGKWMEAFWEIWYNAVDKPSHTKITWYVGDSCYYKDLKGMNHDVVLLNRTENPICATMIRQNPIKHWDKITAPFKRIYSHNILICGTASEGKTTLVQDLGRYFNAPVSVEYAREYMKESCVDDNQLDGADFMAFLQGQYNLNKSLINSPANHGLFFADSDSMVTKMYAQYYMQEEGFNLTEEEYQAVAAMADNLTAKCRWDKIFLLRPHGEFVDDHSRWMGHSGMEEREEMFQILWEEITRAGLWDRVEVLDYGYYENFLHVVDYVNEVIKYGR